MTAKLEQSEIDQLLRESGTGVLALTNGSEAYSIPESFGYDGEALHFQFVFDEDSKKMAFLETTGTASFTVYTSNPAKSVIVSGPIERVPETEQTVAATAVAENAEIPTLNTDPEIPPQELDLAFYRLVPHDISGRKLQDVASRQPMP